MRIAITGTPGTGKTSVASELDHESFNLKELAERLGLGEMKQGELELDVEEMKQELEEFLEDREEFVIEGHLSHHLEADYCVVLRCQPDVLRKRLEKRDYSKEKIDENVESESMDLILQEAIHQQENIIEIDTTGRDPEDVAGEIERRIDEGDTVYGNVDWNEFL